MNIIINVIQDEGGSAELVISSGDYEYRRPMLVNDEDSKEILTQMYDEFVMQDLLQGLIGEIL